jgi:hypothetical protein
MQDIINGLTVLMHCHGPKSKEVEEYLKQYDHIEPFAIKARTLQRIFVEKDHVTQAQT